MATKAASTKEERKGAKNAAEKTKIPTFPRRSNRTGRSIRYRTQPAPMSASSELLMNQQRIIAGGTLLCSCAARCAGNAASNITHQIRTPRCRQRAIQKIVRHFALSLNANRALQARVAWPRFSSLQLPASHGLRSTLLHAYILRGH